MGAHRWFFKKEELNFFDLPEKFDLKNLVYLTPDADNILPSFSKYAIIPVYTLLDYKKTYIIGGLTDRRYTKGK